MEKDRKFDVFDRSKQLKTKSEAWRVPNQPRAFVKKKKERGEDIQEYIENGTAFKSITFKSFGIPISNVKNFREKDCSLFVLYSGGEKREKDYFSYIIDYEKPFSNVRIRYITGTDQVDELVDQAIIDIQDVLGGVITDDIVYLLTDMDTFRDDIIKQKPICVENDINLIVSNPCFEIWLYYSQFEAIPIFTPSLPEKISNEFKGYLHCVTESKSGVDPCKALLLIDTANRNSVKNYNEDEDGLPSLFSTQMHILGERLFERIKGQLEDMEVHFNINKT